MNRGGEFVVKQTKFEGFQFGPLRIFQEKLMKKLVLGGALWGPNITKIVTKP